MGMGWHEWPLMLFTVLGQCVVGAIIVMGLAVIGGNLNEQQSRAVHRSLFFLWLLMGIAFAASTLHLGSPLRAFNALSRVGASPMAGLTRASARGVVAWVKGRQAQPKVRTVVDARVTGLGALE